MAYSLGLLVPQNNYPAAMDQLASTVCDSGAKEGASANEKEALHMYDWQGNKGIRTYKDLRLTCNCADSLGVRYLYFD